MTKYTKYHRRTQPKEGHDHHNKIKKNEHKHMKPHTMAHKPTNEIPTFKYTPNSDKEIYHATHLDMSAKDKKRLMEYRGQNHSY